MDEQTNLAMVRFIASACNHFPWTHDAYTAVSRSPAALFQDDCRLLAAAFVEQNAPKPEERTDPFADPDENEGTPDLKINLTVPGDVFDLTGDEFDAAVSSLNQQIEEQVRSAHAERVAARPTSG